MAHRQRHCSTGGVQLLGELDAGLPRPDDQHPAWRQRLGVAVVVSMHLVDPRPECGRRWDLRRVECAGRDHDLLRPQVAASRVETESAGLAVFLCEAPDLGAENDRRVHDGRVPRGPSRDVVACHERVRVRSLVRVVGQGGHEVRGDESERVPTILPATA
jgi:hypothetical protein